VWRDSECLAKSNPYNNIITEKQKCFSEAVPDCPTCFFRPIPTLSESDSVHYGPSLIVSWSMGLQRVDQEPGESIATATASQMVRSEVTRWHVINITEDSTQSEHTLQKSHGTIFRDVWKLTGKFSNI